MSTFPDPAVQAWFRARTKGPGRRTVADLAAAKDALDLSITVCLPALDEAATIGAICEVITRDLVAGGLVDELLVVDSGSTDGSPGLASAAGAKVVRAAEVLPEVAELRAPGKGESLWKSLAVVAGDIVVWVDSDTRNFDPRFVTRLVAPLLDDPSIGFVKGFYERPFHTEAATLPSEGARVTEIAVRPLLNLFFPALSGVIQPLSGEYAARVDLVRDLPFFTGYAVDVGLLIDVVERYGLDALAQVDLGERVHRNRDVAALGRMSFEIMHALFGMLDEDALVKLAEPLREQLVQFKNAEPARHEVHIGRRPPIARYL